MSHNTVVFIESNTSGTGRLFIKTARDLGHFPVLITKDASRYGFVAEDGVPTLRADTSSLEALHTVCSALNDRQPIAGILSSSEYYVPVAAHLAARFSLPGPDPIAVSRCRDKSFQRLVLQKAGIDDVKSVIVKNVEDLRRAASVMGFPVVLKPAQASGSVGVRLCRSMNELESHLNALQQNQTEPKVILMEECLTGDEYSVEIMNGGIVGITAKHLGSLPYFVETGHDFPADLDPEKQAIIRNFCLHAIKALNLGYGPLHIEVKLDGLQPHLIEVNPRLAGGYIPLLVKAALGRDLISETITLATGTSTNSDPVNPGAATFHAGRTASLRFILPKHDGTITDILCPELSTPGLYDCTLYKTLPLPYRALGDFNDRIGHIIACADNFTLSYRIAEDLIRKIVIRYADFIMKADRQPHGLQRSAKAESGV